MTRKIMEGDVESMGDDLKMMEDDQKCQEIAWREKVGDGEKCQISSKLGTFFGRVQLQSTSHGQ
jgi:hypothetical protein